MPGFDYLETRRADRPSSFPVLQKEQSVSRAVRRTHRRDRPRPTAAALALALAVAVGCGGETAAEANDHLEATAREHAGDRPVAGAAAAATPADSVEARKVAYGTVDGRELTGYLAAPVGAPDSLPGLIVIHEWWGLNEHIRTMTRELAARGYRALAVDLYGDAVAETPDSARALVGSVDGDAARQNLRAAHAWLTERGSSRVGSVGWCFGGGWSLRAALAMPEELDAAVIYYGRPVTDPEQLALLAEHGVPIQGHFGAEDGSIPVSEVEAFEEALTEAGVTCDIPVYEGAGHAFANPSGTRYEPEAAATARDRTLAFLRTHLGSPSARGGG